LKKKKYLAYLGSLLLISAGCALYALAFALFLEPHLIAPGGISGLGMVINYLSGFPIGMSIIIMNAPLLLFSLYKFGARFIASTLYATVLSSALIDLAMAHLSPFTEDLLLASLYGGLLLGVGMGMVFAGGATTGGSDILSKLLRLRFPHLKMGQVMLAVDTVIIIICATVFHNINLALYAAITLYVSTVVIDMILYGSDHAVLSYIISDKHDAVGRAIQDTLDRGVTYLAGTGGHTQAAKQVVMCVVRRNESTALGDLVESIDPDAFMIFTEAHQVFGFGFSPYTRK